MRVVLLGAPGSGRGTQGKRIADHYGMTFISSGALLRDEISRRTTWGCLALQHVERGDYVPDAIINAMVRLRLSEPDCADGFVLDGYPRTLRQLNALDALLAAGGKGISTALAIHVEPGEIVHRRLERAARLGRAEESEKAIRQSRLAYAEQTVPLLAAYDARAVLVWIDGSGTVDEVAARIQGELEPYRSSAPQRPLIRGRN